MNKFTNFSPLSLLLVFTSMLFFSSCSSNKQYFSFSPAPAAYVKKQSPAVIHTAPAAADTPETGNATFTANAAPEQAVILPEIAALKEKTQPVLANVAKAAQANPATAEVKSVQKLTLAQKLVLHKVQKQVKKLNKQDKQTQNAAAPVSSRNAIALILIGLIMAVLGTIIHPLFYTLGVLILLIGLILLVLNYI